MKKIFQFKRIFIWLLIPASFILVFLARIDNRWVEHFFVPFIYSPLRALIGSFVSLFPFSVTEIAAVLLIFLAVWYIVRVVIRIVKQKFAWRHHVYKAFVNTVCAAAIALFGFVICMGLNYYRTGASEQFGLTVTKSTKDDLYGLCKFLAQNLNESRQKADFEREQKLPLYQYFKMSDTARSAYKEMAADYPFLKGTDIRNKPLLSSKMLSAFLTTGIYIPYTFESNINVDVPVFTIPATMCHELTHSRGFMREDEAEFIGYLACMYSDDYNFRYSGYYTAFDYAFEALYNEDTELARDIAKMLSEDVINDIHFQSEYWEKYFKTPAANISEQVYDSYLEANGQQEGIKSYGMMVDLLIAYYKIL